MPRAKKPTPADAPPAHLGAAGLALWQRLRSDFVLTDAAALHLLAVASEAADRGASAREALLRDGVTITDRFGVPKAHPAATIARDAAATQMQALRALGLTGTPED